MKNPRFLTLAGLIIAAAIARLVPHPWNFTPLAAMALFGGAHFQNKTQSFLVPLVALFVSDIFIGFYTGMPFIYGAFTLIVLLGMSLRKNKKPGRIFLTVLASSVSFFIITNFGSWTYLPMYPKTLEGLWACYVAGIPYFRNALAGDLFFSAVLFGGFALAENKFSALKVKQPITIN